MKKFVIVLAILALATGLASAKLTEATRVDEMTGQSRGNVEIFFDDMEGDLSGYATSDLSAGAVSHFHTDTYMAYEGLKSWWCGNFNFDADGGYGNSWDDRLTIPELDLSGATYPILTYAFRYDSEPAYDFTYVQAESAGAYVDLNKGYDGAAAWFDIGVFGFVLATYDNPLKARFRFVSDGAWSDEDGLYASNGGAFMVDIVKVFDYFGGYVYFYDTAEDDSPNSCVPEVPAAAGDFWHPITRKCPAYSDPTSWWCGDDADTSVVPPNLQDALFTPLVDITGADACTAYVAIHFACPTVDNDYLSMYVTATGAGYYSIGGWWGDFGSCDGWGSTGLDIGFDCTQFDVPEDFAWAGMVFIQYTTDNGISGAGGGDAGFMLDDLRFMIPEGVPVEEASWGSIKSMYR